MGLVLSILDIVVLAIIVVGVVRNVWRGSSSRLLAACITVVLCAFAVVSLSAESGLAESSSGLMQVFMLAVLVVIAVLVRFAWVTEPVQ